MQLILVADFPELFFRAGKVFHEGLVGMHAGNRGSSGAAGGIHVTLVVIPGDNPAFTVLISSLQDSILMLRTDLAEQQGKTPSADGVTGGI